MKKLLLNSLLVITLCSSAFSQSLKNSTWYVYDPSNVLTYKVHFATDTGFISSDLSTYYPLTIFYENGNQVTFSDINGAPLACPPADTGRYTFTIQNDTLLFTVLSETCTGRIPVLTLYHWVRNTTGIETQNTTPAIQLFPNPSSDGIFNLKINQTGFDKFSVNTIQGKLILETIITKGAIMEYSVNLSDFPSGIYQLTLRGKQGNKVFKLVR